MVVVVDADPEFIAVLTIGWTVVELAGLIVVVVEVEVVVVDDVVVVTVEVVIGGVQPGG